MSTGRERRFKEDFDSRFTGLQMVSERSKEKMSPLIKKEVCSQIEMRKWVDDWVIKNEGLDEETLNKCMYFINANFKAIAQSSQ